MLFFVNLISISSITFNVISLCDANNQVDVGVVVVVGPALDLTHIVGHLDVLCVGLQVLRGDHDHKLDGPLFEERLVSPTTN